jgi:hypothetical protein
MPRRLIDRGDERWEVAESGRRSQFTKDEFSLVFTRLGGGTAEQRIARYSPKGAKSRELSLARLGDDDLLELLGRSQPSWTAPETGYRR